MNRACVPERVHAIGKLGQDVPWAFIDDGVHRIQTKTVHVELFDPVQGIVDDEFAHNAALLIVIVHRITPVGFMAACQ